jgi:hypothetical protein
MALKVDLTLAVNYLPACVCLGKMLVFMLVLTAIPAEEEVEGLILIAAVLYMDRLTTHNIIFDANAILLAIFFANVHATVRAASQHRAYGGLVDGMYLFWGVGSLVLLWDPPAVKQVPASPSQPCVRSGTHKRASQVFDRRVRMAKIVPVLLMLLIVGAMSHFHSPLEPGGLRACRALAFTLLSFAWVYTVGIHSAHGIEYLKENSCQFVARLSPALYMSPWIAAGFTVGATAGFVVQFMRMSAADVSPPPPVDLEQSAPPPPVIKPQPKADESEEELFRQARMQSLAVRGRTQLDPIYEGSQ